MGNECNINCEYIRRLYDNVTDWYKSADAKAQVILAIDGAFIAFLTVSVFTKQNEVKELIRTINPITWILLGTMICCAFGSIIVSICSLWSRIYSKREVITFIEREVKKAKETGDYRDVYPPSVMWFFQFIERLDKKIFQATVRSADEFFECESLSANLSKLARNVRVKHFAVNIGFTLVGIALFLFFCAATTHICLLMN